MTFEYNKTFPDCWAEISTFDPNFGEEGELVDRKIKNLIEHESRVWLGKHMLWAMANGYEVEIVRAESVGNKAEAMAEGLWAMSEWNDREAIMRLLDLRYRAHEINALIDDVKQCWIDRRNVMAEGEV